MDPELLSKFPSKPNQCLQWKYDDIPSFHKHTQYTDFKEQIIEKPKTTIIEKPNTTKKQNPLEFASEFCSTDIDYIREQLLDFISIKEFQSVFGVKNTTEIMKGITNNKWNKQLILLFSFLFDISFLYLKKDVMFDTTKTPVKKIII